MYYLYIDIYKNLADDETLTRVSKVSLIIPLYFFFVFFRLKWKLR